MAHETVQVKKLVENMDSYASKLENQGKLKSAEIIREKAENFRKAGRLTPRILSATSLSAFVLSSLFSGMVMTGNAVGNSNATSWLGILFFSAGIICAAFYMEDRKRNRY